MANGKRLMVGEKVLWTECDVDVPPGAVGTVLGFKADDAVRVQFPKGRWVFPADTLVTPDSEPVDKGCLGKFKALPGELKTKLYLGCPLIAMIMVVYTLALYVLDFYSDILLVFEVLPIMSVIYPSAMTVPVFSKSILTQEHSGVPDPFGNPIYFGMAHTGTRRGEELPPMDSMENLGGLPYFDGQQYGRPDGQSCAATTYPVPNFLQKTANYDLFMTASSSVRPGAGKLLMYWDRANNYGAKCYGLDYGEEPLLLDPDDGSEIITIGKRAGDPMQECPEPYSIMAVGNITGRGEDNRNIRYGNPPFDPTWPDPVLNLDPDSYMVDYGFQYFNAEESDYATMHCHNTMTTLPLSDNPDCEVWDPELCTCPTDRSHLLGQTSLDPKHGHVLPKFTTGDEYATLTKQEYLEHGTGSCKCIGVTNGDGEGDDCLDFHHAHDWGASAWCYTAEGACEDGSFYTARHHSFLGYEVSHAACKRHSPGGLELEYSHWDWSYVIGTVAFRCYVDARTPMVLSVLATIAAMIAKELAGILVVIFMPRHAYADVLDVAADSIISALYLMYRVIQDCFRPVGLRAAIVDPTGKHTKPLIPMEHFIPKITMLWKVLVVVEVLASLTLVATAFYQIVVFRGYITDHVQQPYEGSYWEKINVPPVNWETGAKFGGGKDRDPALYQIDLPAAMYYSLITSLLTVFSKVKDCIGTAAGPSKEPDDSPEEPEEQVAAPDEKDVDQDPQQDPELLVPVGPDQVSLAKKEISLLPVASVQRAEKSADMTQEPTTVEP